MRKFIWLSTTLWLLLVVPAASPRQSGDISPIIPAPHRADAQKGFFRLTPETKIGYSEPGAGLEFISGYLAKILRSSTGYKLPVKEGMEKPQDNSIYFEFVSDLGLGDEGYRLDVGRKNVRIGASAPSGFFYAVQSLLQLMPAPVYGGKKIKNIPWKIPAISVSDRPRFSWRGMHLDVSRHFFPAGFIKTYIDMLAMHKMNVFHWHLTDDQGWRIEIKKYPKLASVAAWRADREDRLWDDREPQRPGEAATYGGFYTQEEIKEIVRYASERHVTIVPEIEMPAHAGAALAAYPEYSCTGGPFTVPPGGVWPITNLYCAGNDSTFEFLESVLSEVIDLFPGRFIHVGGDEADKSEWKKCPKCQSRMNLEDLKDESELQSYFIKRMEKFIISKNRRMIGWDEILEGGLAPEATVMSWRGMEGGITAARMNHDVVMTPGSHCYFDYYQGKPDYEPPAIGGYTALSKVYGFEPVPDSLRAEQAGRILGAQANIWTEFIPDPAQVEYMALPRMAALAEVLWSPKEMRDWDRFVPRVILQMDRYSALKYNYSKSAYLVSISPSLDSVRKEFGFELSNELKSGEIRYTLDGKEPTLRSPIYRKPFKVSKSVVVKAAAFRNEKPLSVSSREEVFLHKALFRPVALKYPYRKYTGGGELGLTNGIRGTKSHNDGNWQGFEQDDMEAVIDLGRTVGIKTITASFLQNTASWIFFPLRVEYALSDDGIDYRTVASANEPIAGGHQEVGIKEFPAETKASAARYIKVTARNVGLCPDWHGGRGGKAWIFADEIVVE